jgi:chromosome segregation protein
LRERINELRLKEQAAQINYDQYERSCARRARRGEARGFGRRRAATLQPAGEITRLTQAMNELGAVNLCCAGRALQRARAQELPGRAVADLGGSRHDMEDAIRKIDRETRSLLKDTFDSVNRHFGSLFPGAVRRRRGEAHHDRRGDSRRRCAGDGAPAGKRNTSIHLLSGRREGG